MQEYLTLNLHFPCVCARGHRCAYTHVDARSSKSKIHVNTLNVTEEKSGVITEWHNFLS